MRNLDKADGWNGVEKLSPKEFTCYKCGNNICSNEGYRYGESVGGEYRSYEDMAYIYICHKCKSPTYFNEDDEQVPGSLYGDNILYLPKEVESVYDEARKCFSVNAFTSVVLCCRKLLMNISCELGASEGLNFVNYIDYLERNNHIPSKATPWIDKIRLLGNAGTHKMENRSREDAELSIQFTSILLKIIYEMPGRLENIK